MTCGSMAKPCAPRKCLHSTAVASPVWSACPRTEERLAAVYAPEASLAETLARTRAKLLEQHRSDDREALNAVAACAKQRHPQDYADFVCATGLKPSDYLQATSASYNSGASIVPAAASLPAGETYRSAAPAMPSAQTINRLAIETIPSLIKPSCIEFAVPFEFFQCLLYGQRKKTDHLFVSGQTGHILLPDNNMKYNHF